MKKSLKNIHMLGICGTGMGSLAGLLIESGYKITGSDQNIYPPMSTQLSHLGIEPNKGFSADNINYMPDLAVIGNVITKDNPEIQEIIRNKIPYKSMPETLETIFLDKKESLVIAGTHGKTTTSNIVAWLLDYAGLNPSFLIGGVGLNFGKSYNLANGNHFVIEGDEYDTAFFDKGPKFLHYKPKHAIINEIEFDHADIYKNLEHIKDAFRKFIKLIPKNNFCIVNGDSKNVRDIVSSAKCKVITFGFSDNVDYKIKIIKTTSRGTEFQILYNNTLYELLSPLFGKHNLLNAVAGIALLHKIGLKIETLSDGLKKFEGVKRRQEVLSVSNQITVIDDFAHHPTAIRETLWALKNRYPDGKLWAIFEPRSNTTRRKIFQKELAKAFNNADKVIISKVYNAEKLNEKEKLDTTKLVQNIHDNGIDAYSIEDTKNIIEFIVRSISPSDVIVIMSNGAFNNIHEDLIKNINKRKFFLTDEE